MPFARPEIASMRPYVPGEQPPAGKFIKLNTNENPYPPSAAVPLAIRSALEGGLQRYPDPSATAFRHRAAHLWNLDPSWILCGNGSDELLNMAIRTFVGHGQELRYPAPTYTLFRTLGQVQGARVHAVSFAPDWCLPAVFFQDHRDTRLVILSNPNSPSGTCLSREVVRRVAECFTCPVLVDEAYVEFADGHCLDLVRDVENLVITRSLSKSYALAGLRFGYMVARPDILEQVVKVKDSYNCDSLAIAGATAAIGDQDWLRQTTLRIVATRQRMRQRLIEIGFDVVPSQANFLWCTRTDSPVEPLYEQLKRRHILVRYMDFPDWGDGLRISVGTDEQVDALLTVLATLVNESPACLA